MEKKDAINSATFFQLNPDTVSPQLLAEIQEGEKLEMVGIGLRVDIQTYNSMIRAEVGSIRDSNNIAERNHGMEKIATIKRELIYKFAMLKAVLKRKSELSIQSSYGDVFDTGNEIIQD